ncbi:hypothetical protein J3458_007082 [Metarhizium acridum]|uniref:uncharacterized protein n=1 Tax=Metarhizium acridum TaxID=92637 RepID=UPI001C6AD1DA|nr:hypothetical protein J3458_007082 [Metarhizium acridum]
MSWAVVDYYLVKKPAYYAISPALRPLNVGVSRTYHDWTQIGYYIDKNLKLCTGQANQTLPARESTFDVWIASSKVQAVKAKVTVRFISIRSGRDVSEGITAYVSASANAATTVFSSKPLKPSIPYHDDYTTPFDATQYDTYVVYTTLSVDGVVVATDAAWPDPIKSSTCLTEESHLPYPKTASPSLQTAPSRACSKRCKARNVVTTGSTSCPAKTTSLRSRDPSQRINCDGRTRCRRYVHGNKNKTLDVDFLSIWYSHII